MRRHGGALRRRYGQSRSMSFGVMPSYKAFVAGLKEIDPETGSPYLGEALYRIEAGANSKDAKLLHRARISPALFQGDYGKNRYELTHKQLYSALKKLAKMPSSEDGEDGPGLASSIMTTLGYEWI